MSPPSLSSRDSSPAWELLKEALEAGDADAVQALMQAIPEGEVPRLFAHLSSAESHEALAMLDPELAGELMKTLPDALAADVVEGLEPEEAAAIVTTLPSNTQADILSDFEPEYAEAVLSVMPAEDAADAERLTQYSEGTAGGVMITEYLSYSDQLTVGDVLADLRAHQKDYQRHDVQYVYVTGDRGVLKGVLRLRDLVLSSPNVLLRDIMIAGTDFVPVDADIDALHDFFSTRSYRGVPVVDDDGRLVGVVRHADVFRVWGKELSVGAINAVALGLLLGAAAFLWQGNVTLSIVVGLALTLNTLLSVSLGGLVPLVLRGLKLDPALASGPILTTVTDMCGFFLVLSFATAALPSLGT